MYDSASLLDYLDCPLCSDCLIDLMFVFGPSACLLTLVFWINPVYVNRLDCYSVLLTLCLSSHFCLLKLP